MTLDEQLDFFDRKAERAYAECLRDVRARKAEVIAEARQRLIDGHALYGAQGFAWPHERLHAAELEEVADMVNYRLMKMHQGWPR